jgi:ATP-dependent Clp protease ATP-binding subunit ClpC
MNVTYNRSSLRARKARLARRFTAKIVLLCKVVVVLLAITGLVLIITGNRAGAVLLAAGVSVLLLLIWHHGELKQLPATLPKEDTDELVLDLALDRELLAVLPANATAQDIWQAVKDHWQRHFFRVRFGLDNFCYLPQLEQTQISPDEVWVESLQLARRHGLPTITPGTVALALFLRTPTSQAVLNALHLEQADLEHGLSWLKHLEDTIDKAKHKEHYGGVGRDWAAGYTPLLNEIAHNISLDIQQGGLWTRETESHESVITQMVNTLANSRSSSVALVGPLGVGKTTAVYALAKKLLTENVPSLRYHQVFSLNAATIIANAGNYRSLEQLMLSVFGEAARAGNIILFLDEAQLFMRAGTGSVDLTNLLLQVLQSGRVHLICAMTPEEWQLLSASNANLAGQMNYQIMPPPTPTDTIRIMQDQLLGIEHKHGVVFMYQAIQEAHRLAEKYIHDMEFPGRGVRILEEAAVFAGSGLVTAGIVGKSMEAKLGVKVVQATGAERQQLLNLEDELHKRLINQTRAVSVVADALRRARSGVSNPDRPVGTFLFLGPTGVGKTELAKALADVYFNGRDLIIRVNLNEYSRPDDVTRLLAVSTVEGGGSSLLAQIRRQPYSVVLMDEIEKAHPDVLNVLLQLLDEGVIQDSTGKEVSFKDAIVIATSNAGADIIRQQIEAGHDLEEFEESFVNQLIDNKLFQPEFLNRFDEIVLFRPLKPEELQQVVALMIEEVNQTLQRQKVKVTLSEAALAWLVERGNDPRLGARPMRRMVQRSVENVVAKKILSGEAGPGSEINLDIPDLESTGQ